MSSLQTRMRSGMSQWLARSSGSTSLLNPLACFDQVWKTQMQSVFIHSIPLLPPQQPLWCVWAARNATAFTSYLLERHLQSDCCMASGKYSTCSGKGVAFLEACCGAAGALQHFLLCVVVCLHSIQVLFLCRHIGAFHSHGGGSQAPAAGCL